MGPEMNAAALGGRATAENEHFVEALEIYSSIGREALLNRLCVDGEHTAAFALHALRAESPTLADAILAAFADYTDEVDELLLALGDAAAREAA